MRDAEAAEEVVQETFVAALGARDQYSGRGSEGAWLLEICKRKVVDHVRRRNRPDAGVGGDLGPDPSEAMFDAKGNWRFDPRVLKGRPERALEREEFWQAFRGCLQRLSQRQADAFKGGTPQTVFFAVGLVMTVVATVVITRVARRALNEAVAEHRAPAEDGTQAPVSHLNGNAIGVQ